jgi:hypothetical protein
MSRNRSTDTARPALADFDDRVNSYSAAASAADVSERATQASALSDAGHRWVVYSTAAVAGIGMLAAALPAEGEIVSTKADIPIAATFSAIPPTALDLNGDGVADLRFSRYIFGYYRSIRDNVRTVGAHKAALVGTSNHTYRGWGYASALKAGAPIGPSAHFAKDDVMLFARSQVETSNGKTLTQHLYGKWLGNSPERFLGVRFLIDSVIHYGWVRLTITSGPGKEAVGTITGYAYETIAGKTIKAGAVSDDDHADDKQADDIQAPAKKLTGPSLGILALGAHGLSLWRYEGTSASN